MAKKLKKQRKLPLNANPSIGVTAPSTRMYPSATALFNKKLELKFSRKKAKGLHTTKAARPTRRIGYVRPSSRANHSVQTVMNWRARRTTRTLNLLNRVVVDNDTRTRTKERSAFNGWFYSAKRGVKNEARRRSRLSSYRRWIRNRKKQTADGIVYRTSSLPLKGGYTISIRMNTVDYTEERSSKDIDFKGIHQLLKNCDTTKWKIKWRKYHKDDYRRFSNRQTNERQFDCIYATDDTTVFLINMNFPCAITTVFRHPTK